MKKETKVILTLSCFILLSLYFSLQKNTASSPNRHQTDNSLQTLSLRKDNIAILHIEGPISYQMSGQFYTQNKLDDLIAQLHEYEDNPKVKALILRINSPGGTVGSSQELYQEIANFKERRQIPVIASVADICTSGAYWAALAADTIFANPGSIVGNIGVIVKTYNLTEIAKKYGIGQNTYKSGKYKDLLSSWRNPSKEEQALIKAMIHNVHTQFVDTVMTERKFSKKEALKLSDGRIFSGEQAKKYAIIDEVGGFHDAITYAKKQANIQGKALIITPQRHRVLEWMNLLKNQLSPLSQLTLLETLENKTSLQ